MPLPLRGLCQNGNGAILGVTLVNVCGHFINVTTACFTLTLSLGKGKQIKVDRNSANSVYGDREVGEGMVLVF